MKPEVWMRGPVDGYARELQPVVHALLQVREEVDAHASDLTVEELWARPGGAAAIGFHLRHIAGATDRLLTYARGESLTPEQFAFLKAEGLPGDPPATAADTLAIVLAGIDAALEHVRRTDAATLFEPRAIGRAKLPTTVIGLIFHTAEHAARHAGQIATTRKVIGKPAPAVE
ncbi:MAG: DinB family protein [Acidobacteria bacterium]|nr:DinB family protein [Acidobacteriota bacterium]